MTDKLSVAVVDDDPEWGEFVAKLRGREPKEKVRVGLRWSDLK